ncbi:MAG: hypothetical protein ACSHX9_11775 [Luteolibacter sp.]
MKVYVFHPSNEFFGKFDIPNIEALESEFTKFANETQVTAYDYLECDNRMWTVVEGSDGLSLQEGRVLQSSDTSNPRNNSKPLNRIIKERYQNHRYVSLAAIRFASFIMVLGWILGCLIALYGMYSLGSSYSTRRFFFNLLPWLIHGALVAIVLHFFSLLLATLARLLDVNLDTTINSSPHLSEEEKAQALGKL